MKKNYKYIVIKMEAYNDEVETESFISGKQDTERYEKDVEKYDNFKLGEFTLIITEQQRKNLLSRLQERTQERTQE